MLQPKERNCLDAVNINLKRQKNIDEYFNEECSIFSAFHVARSTQKQLHYTARDSILFHQLYLQLSNATHDFHLQLYSRFHLPIW